MDDVQIGRALRRIRHERGWTQQETAVRAGLSRPLLSRLEGGRLDTLDLGAIRRVAAALEARIALDLTYRGADLARLLSSRHTAMADAMIGRLRAAGWDARPEVSFSHFGERGVIDIVAWHEARRALLLVEIKTEFADIGSMLATDDRRRRLARTIAKGLDWDPLHVSSWLVVAESRTNRRHAARFEALLRARFPEDGSGIRSWLADPVGPSCALWFLSSVNGGNTSRRASPTRRIRHARTVLGPAPDARAGRHSVAIR